MKTKKIIKVFLFIIFSHLIFSCEDNPTENFYPPDNSERVTISEGVWGNVWFWEGNFMPGSPDGTITPVVREIYVYKATKGNLVQRDDYRYPLIRDINSELVTVIKSDVSGFFEVALPEGKYSFFAKEDSLFFGSESDEEGFLMSAEVISNQVTKRQININYKAAY